jgi:MraZ protein
LFRGRFETVVDGKGRTSLPARYRENLAATDDNRMVLTQALEPCLRAYPYTKWLEFEKKLSEAPSFDPHIIRIKRIAVTSAMECAVDSHGRILIPQILRESVGISRDVIWAGMVDYAEIWDAAKFRQAFETATGDDAAVLGKALADFGL